MCKIKLLVIAFLITNSTASCQVKSGFSFTIECHKFLAKKNSDLQFELRLINLTRKIILIPKKHITEANNKGNVGDVSYEIISCSNGDTVTKSSRILDITYHFPDISSAKMCLGILRYEVIYVQDTLL